MPGFEHDCTAHADSAETRREDNLGGISATAQKYLQQWREQHGGIGMGSHHEDGVAVQEFVGESRESLLRMYEVLMEGPLKQMKRTAEEGETTNVEAAVEIIAAYVAAKILQRMANTDSTSPSASVGEFPSPAACLPFCKRQSKPSWRLARRKTEGA